MIGGVIFVHLFFLCNFSLLHPNINSTVINISLYLHMDMDIHTQHTDATYLRVELARNDTLHHLFTHSTHNQENKLSLSLSFSTVIQFNLCICFSPVLSLCVKVYVFVPFPIIVRSIVLYATLTVQLIHYSPNTRKPSTQHIIWYIRFWFCLKNVHTLTHTYAKTD